MLINIFSFFFFFSDTAAERDGLINSVRKAELSKYEIQLLIDLLLNKQLEAPAIINDWSEVKSLFALSLVAMKSISTVQN